MKKTALVWFRKDLRLHDNPALFKACSEYQQVIPIYIHAPQEEHPWEPGQASLWWLHHSLTALKHDLKKNLNLDLLCFTGHSQEILQSLIQNLQIDALFWNRRYEPALIARDSQIKAHFKAIIEVESFSSFLLCEPHHFANKEGKPYLVFTSFYKALSQKLPEKPILGLPPRPSQSTLSGKKIEHPTLCSIEELRLLPTIPWDKEFYKTHRVGETHTRKNLQIWLKNRVVKYAQERDFPSIPETTSHLSAPLTFGEISVREALLWAQNTPHSEPFVRQLFWREFAWHILVHFPHTPTQCYKKEWNLFAWEKNEKHLKKWTQGKTGFDLVDAGMQELWKTGLMHNRVRMLVASVLTKYAQIHWLEGAQWFWNTLVDADLANNTLGWQWVAGCGTDAAPYFRIFNPETQQQKFDPLGEYCKTWLNSQKPIPPFISTQKGHALAMDKYRQFKDSQRLE